MVPYASNTCTRRNLEVLRGAGWHLLLTPGNVKKNGLPDRMRFAIDNGAFSVDGFDAKAFSSLVERVGCAADFVVLPDIVAGGNESLALSASWIPKLRGLRRLLLPIQDGVSAVDVGLVLREHPHVGLFLGGSTEYKLRTIYSWGMVAASWKRHYHVGRVNSARRVRLCAEAGADSFDGTGPTKYASRDVPILDAAARQPSLLVPGGGVTNGLPA